MSDPVRATRCAGALRRHDLQANAFTTEILYPCLAAGAAGYVLAANTEIAPILGRAKRPFVRSPR